MKTTSAFTLVAYLTLVFIAAGCNQPAAPPVASNDQSEHDDHDDHDHDDHDHDEHGDHDHGDHDHDDHDGHDHDDDDHDDHDGHDHDDHDHHHADTFAGALTELTEFNTAIQKASEAGDLEPAHHDLHEVGHVLGELDKLAEKAGFSADQLKVVKDTTGKLMDAFGSIDATLHDEKGHSYSDVASDITSAMDVLKGLASEQASVEQ